MLSKTKVLVLASLVLSFASVWTGKKGWGEIYPFFTWKLYSQPAGWELEHTNLRVYAKKKNKSRYERLENKPRASFNRDETLYFLNPITNLILDEHIATDSLKLKVFCKHIAPEYDQYKVVEERFKPLEIINNPEKYDTTTLIVVE